MVYQCLSSSLHTWALLAQCKESLGPLKKLKIRACRLKNVSPGEWDPVNNSKHLQWIDDPKTFQIIDRHSSKGWFSAHSQMQPTNVKRGLKRKLLKRDRREVDSGVWVPTQNYVAQQHIAMSDTNEIIAENLQVCPGLSRHRSPSGRRPKRQQTSGKRGKDTKPEATLLLEWARWWMLPLPSETTCHEAIMRTPQVSILWMNFRMQKKTSETKWHFRNPCNLEEVKYTCIEVTPGRSANPGIDSWRHMFQKYIAHVQMQSEFKHWKRKF